MREGRVLSLAHVSQNEILTFADSKVNLHRDDVKGYREQVWRLRDKLETYLSDHPDFSLKKMMLSGSLAKGTALRTINDIDVAMYVNVGKSTILTSDLIQYLAKKLETAFPNFSADQIEPQNYSVKVSFKGSGLDVDIAPILYDSDPNWRGQLVSQEDGTLLETSIPMHLDFCRTRKSKSPKHFSQNVRLAKFWARRCKSQIDGFRFKSFMIELIFAKLSDDGVDLSFYPESL
jgi:predicted nucleotidyltransferase